MKKKSLFLPLVAALALTGCSNDDLVIDDANSANGESRYLAVSIVSTDGSFGTRAEGTAADPSKGNEYQEGASSYEDGLGSENDVKGLRIYFFGPNGSPINVKGHDDGGNYYDVPAEQITVNNTETPDHSGTVEKTLNAVVVVDKGEHLPSKLIAVVNPTPELLSDKSAYTTRALRAFVNDYSKEANENKRFVMTNSAYAESGTAVDATQIVSDNFQTSIDDAKAHPVTIYVERNVAKVRVNSAIADKVDFDGVVAFKVKDKDGKDLTITKMNADGTQGEEVGVYVKFHGWDITADLQYGYLLKGLNTGWADDVSGLTNWNDPSHHRSYWATVCGGGTSKDQAQLYYSYNKNDKFKQTKFNGSEWKYCNENADKKYKTTTYAPTSVLIKGELCDVNGKPLTVTEIAGTRIVDDESGTNIKSTYLEMLKVGREAHTHYKAVKDASGKIIGYEEIGVEDITFMTASVADTREKAVLPTNGRYYVYACLTTQAESEEWYTGTGLSKDSDGKWQVKDAQSINAAQLNTHLYEMGHAKVWKNGMTYYYADILHHTDPNVLGVVRNHIYDINFTNIVGLGTPVYNPEEVIIPEKPSRDDTYVAAEIKILSWRLVSSNVSLDWGNDL